MATFKFKYLAHGDTQVPVLHPDSRDAFYKRNLEQHVVARTYAGKVVGQAAPGASLQNIDTLWVVEEIVGDPSYMSGFRARGVTYLDNPDSTEVKSERTPWLDLDWFVPVGAEYEA